MIAEAETARSPRPGIDCLVPTLTSRRSFIAYIFTLSMTYMSPAGQIACDRRGQSVGVGRKTTLDTARHERQPHSIRLSPTFMHYAAAASPCSIDEPPRFKVGDSRSRDCQITAAWH